MTIARSRPAMLLAMLALLALFVTAGSVYWMQAQRASAQQAADDLAACQALVQLVKDLRSQSTGLSTQSMEHAELTQRVEHSTQYASLPASAIEGIVPQPAQRVGSLPFMEKPTTILLRRVELSTAIAFLYDLTDSPGLTVRQVHFHAPHGDAPSNQWDADATITGLVAAPVEPQRGK